ncbi:MAG: hypothetical protein MI740_17405 [Halanaerobiales bacterium]|nr:hypothetical protein [Halanaerobiales bacterium]
MLEFILENESEKETLELPVPPQTFSINKSIKINTEELNGIGEVAIQGQRKLDTITINSFFPTQVYNFVQYRDFPAPYDCVELLNKWRLGGSLLRLIITETDINLPVLVESFEYGERDGTGDVYFTLNLKEYREFEQGG